MVRKLLVPLIGLIINFVFYFFAAAHSSRAPASGSQTGDTLGKALASVRFGLGPCQGRDIRARVSSGCTIKYC